jgi:hypothetical protein
MPATNREKVLGYVLMHTDGIHYWDGKLWRRFWGRIKGRDVVIPHPLDKRCGRIGWHSDERSAREAAKVLHATTGEKATPTRVCFLSIT